MRLFLIRHAQAGPRGLGHRDLYRPLSPKGHQRAESIAELPRLQLRGLMLMPPEAAQGDAARPHFARLRELAEDLRGRGHALDSLSMGMTGDLEAAIAEGATLVRVGTAIFGPRRTD